MNNRSFFAGALAIAMLAGLPSALFADEKAEFEAAWAEADAARQKAASVGGEWRDTGKMLKQAKAASEAGEHDKAMGLVDKAKKQGELGHAQAMKEKDTGMPDYMK